MNNFAQINEIGLKVIALNQTQGTNIHVLCCILSLEENSFDDVYFEKEKEKGQVKFQPECTKIR